jgi:hypothetical protein
MLNVSEADIDAMSDRWFGYGRWDAPYWFIGPEPGMAKSEGDNLSQRCAAWLKLGGGELVDCMAHHEKLGVLRWHRADNTPTQDTWRQLIRLLLAYKDQPSDNRAIAEYQRTSWGAITGETCVVELSSLAARSLLTPRDRKKHREQRINTLRARMQKSAPKFAVLYGLRDRKSFEKLVGGPFDVDGFRQLSDTLLALTYHPVGGRPAKPDSYWIELGRKLRQRVPPT